jgi:hypothetical protein
MSPVIPPNGCATVGASNTIQSMGHGLAGTPTDGSAAVWIDTASGPRWFTLTGIPDGDTFTVQSWQTPNIAAAVDCVVGGRLAGPLSALNITSARGLCRDFGQGWTITIVNTGTDYTEANSVGCPLNGNTFGGGIGTFGRQLIRGDDPDNPTRLVVTFNGSLITQTTGNISVKVENLEFVRNVAGNAGVALVGATSVANAAYTFKNVRVSQTSGTWANGWAAGGSPMVVMNSLFDGPFTSNCASLDDDDLIIATVMLGCSGTTSAILASVGNVMFSIMDNGGANTPAFSGSTNNGAGGLRLFNTLLNIGTTAVNPGSNLDSAYSGNLIEEASTLSGACFSGGTGAADLLGAAGAGFPSNIWRGNAADLCPTARYAGGLDTSTLGAATDLLAGAQFDPLFRDEGNLDFFPTNEATKSDLVFPGAAWPLLTPALPVSTMTSGAAQRVGGGSSAYAY